ncbi:MAG: hypothetical protein L6R39_000829, partial [Caloplaca ligustica]
MYNVRREDLDEVEERSVEKEGRTLSAREWSSSCLTGEMELVIRRVEALMEDLNPP